MERIYTEGYLFQFVVVTVVSRKKKKTGENPNIH